MDFTKELKLLLLKHRYRLMGEYDKNLYRYISNTVLAYENQHGVGITLVKDDVPDPPRLY